MKTLSLLVLLLCCCTPLSAQSPTPQSLIGGQAIVILPGIGLYADWSLGGEVVVRTEVSAALGYAYSRQQNNERAFAATLSATVGPRWYYNYAKRLAGGRSVYRNSANFLSLRATYLPGTLLFRTSDFAVPLSGFTLIPHWGIRRPLGKLTFECSAGLGYRYTDEGYGPKTGGGAIDVRFALGF